MGTLSNVHAGLQCNLFRLILLLLFTENIDGLTTTIKPINESSLVMSDWMMTTFIIAGIIITFWALCICGLAICLLRLYYTRRKKEILIKNKLNDNLATNVVDIDKAGSGSGLGLGVEINKDTVHMHISKDTTHTQSDDTLNTQRIIQQTDGMETRNIDINEQQFDIDIDDDNSLSSRESDDDIYEIPENIIKKQKQKQKHKHKHKKKSKKSKHKHKHKHKHQRRPEPKTISMSDINNNIHMNTRSINMEESHDRGHSSLTYFGKHTIISDHTQYPSLPSGTVTATGTGTGVVGVTSGNILNTNGSISQTHMITPSSFATSYIYENCATPDGLVFNATNIGILHAIDPNIPSRKNIKKLSNDTTKSSPQYQLPKYQVTKDQWM